VAGRLPDFLIVGAPKAGTTSVAQWLNLHPECFVPLEKELHFFSDDANWARGLDWYADRLGETGDAPLVGEGTPFYMYHPLAVARMAEVVPHAKLIVTLREPGARAFSNWCQTHYRLVIDDRPFAAMVDDELREGVPSPGRERASAEDRRYLAVGLYARQLRSLYEHFPREQVLVVFMEEMKADPEAAFAEVCRFLGIAEGQVPRPELVARNAYKEFRPIRLWRFIVRHRVLEPFPPRVGKFIALRVMLRSNVPPRRMDPATRARLDEFYAAPDRELAELLGRELPWRDGAAT
jgi:hypothetical protein